MPEPWKKANFLWIGAKLSPVEILALKSHVATGWETTIFTYGDVEGIPDGCVVKDGNTILAEDLIFSTSPNDAPGVTFASFADLFRWSLLSREAGWWFDVDMVSIRPPQPVPSNTPVRFASTWEGEWAQCATNCAMYSDGEHRLFHEAFERSRRIVEGGEAFGFPTLGPWMLQQLIREHELENCVAPWQEFCPYPWRQIIACCSPTTTDHVKSMLRVLKHASQAMLGADIRPALIRPGTRSVHLHNEIWRTAGISKSGPFSKYSFVGRQIKKYGIPGVTLA